MKRKLAAWLILMCLVLYNCPNVILYADANMDSVILIEAGAPGLQDNYLRIRTSGDPLVTIGNNSNFIIKIGIGVGLDFVEDITLNPGDDYTAVQVGNDIHLIFTALGAGVVQDSINNDFSTHAEVSISGTPINLDPLILNSPQYSSLTPVNLNPVVEPEPEPEPVLDKREIEANDTIKSIEIELEKRENLNFENTKESSTSLIDLLESDLEYNTFIKLLPNLQDLIKLYTYTYTQTDDLRLVDLVQELVYPFTRNLLRLYDTHLIQETGELMKTLSAITGHDAINRSKLNETGILILDAVSEKLSTERITFTMIQNSKRNFVIDNPKAKPRAEKIKASLESLDVIRSNYFDGESTYTLKNQILFALDTPQDQMGFEATIAPEIQKLMNDYNLDFLTLKINGAYMELHSSHVNPKSETIISLSFDYETIPQTVVSRENFSKGQLVNFEYSTDGLNRTQFDIPLSLKFELKRFTFSKDTHPDQLAIYRYQSKADLWVPVGGSYNPITLILSVKRSNLSQYTVLKSTRTFNDIENTSAKDAVQKLLNKGVLQPTTSFNPDAPLTREEFASWIAKTYGLSAPKTITLPFTDVSKNSAHYDSIAAVYSQGLVSGKSKTIFDPKGNITKQEMAKIIGGALVLYENKKSNVALTTRILATGTDLPDWAQTGISLMVDLGYMDTSDLNATTSLATKESVAAIMGNLF